MSGDARVVVLNLSYDTTDESLNAAFSSFGDIEEAAVVLGDSGRSRGFGFVNFATAEACAAALAAESLEVDGRDVRVEKPRGGGSRRGGGGDGARSSRPFDTVYAADLPWQLEESELQDYFAAFGKVTRASLAFIAHAPEVDGYRPHRGYGWVTFAEKADAAKAVSHSGHSLKGASITVRPSHQRKGGKGGPDGAKGKGGKGGSDGAKGKAGGPVKKKDPRGPPKHKKSPASDASTDDSHETSGYKRPAIPVGITLAEAPQPRKRVAAAPQAKGGAKDRSAKKGKAVEVVGKRGRRAAKGGAKGAKGGKAGAAKGKGGDGAKAEDGKRSPPNRADLATRLVLREAKAASSDSRLKAGAKVTKAPAPTSTPWTKKSSSPAETVAAAEEFPALGNPEELAVAQEAAQKRERAEAAERLRKEQARAQAKEREQDAILAGQPIPVTTDADDTDDSDAGKGKGDADTE